MLWNPDIFASQPVIINLLLIGVQFESFMAKRSTWTRYPCCKLDFNPLWQVQDSLSHCYGIQHAVECACHSIEFSIIQYLCSHVVPTAKCIAASGTESISPTRHVGGYLHPRIPITFSSEFPNIQAFPRYVACRDSNATDSLAIKITLLLQVVPSWPINNQSRIFPESIKQHSIFVMTSPPR
jgi:hypothetical protein